MPLTAAALADTRHHLHPYTQLRQLEQEGPLVIVRGDGVHVVDEHGQRYLEGMAGLWCASLGFSDPDDKYRLTFHARNIADESYVLLNVENGRRLQIPRDADRYFGVSLRARFR